METLLGSIETSWLFWSLFALAAAWNLAFKGMALWYAARNQQRAWFVALLIVNTLGILDIIYLIWFRKDRANVTPSLFEQPAEPSGQAVA